MPARFTRNRIKVGRLRYTRLLWPRKGYRHRGVIYLRYAVDRYEFYKAGFAAILRLPGKLWSPAFMAAYQIAFTCQKPFHPAHNSRSLATRISICSNLLLLTPEFRQLNAETRARYQYLIEDFCSQLAGCPIHLNTHPTAMFIYRHRSRREVQRQIRMLRRLVANAGALSFQDGLRLNTVDLKQWTKEQRAIKSAAREARIAARTLRRSLKVTRRDAKQHALQRMRARFGGSDLHGAVIELRNRLLLARCVKKLRAKGVILGPGLSITQRASDNVIGRTF